MARPQPWLKPAVFTASLVPLGSLAFRGATGELGANPIAEALNRLGLTALVFLVATLALTPLRLLFGWTWPPRLSRMLGLFAFFYAACHFALYVAGDQVFAWRAILDDIAKRKFILVGFLALVLMVPLAITSTKGMVRRLGFARWKRLHRLAYLAGGLGAVHFIWRVKKDLSEPVIYAAVLGALFAVRLWKAARKETNSRAAP